MDTLIVEKSSTQMLFDKKGEADIEKERQKDIEEHPTVLYFDP